MGFLRATPLNGIFKGRALERNEIFKGEALKWDFGAKYGTAEFLWQEKHIFFLKVKIQEANLCSSLKKLTVKPS